MSEAPDEPGDGGASSPTEAGWRRLDVRVLGVHGVRLAAALAPIALLLVLGGELSRTVAITLVAIFGGAAFSAARDAVGWATTRYAVSDERVDVRSGLLSRSLRSIPRDRVRTVNVTAKPLHRLFAIATVEIGTGSGEKHPLMLDAVPALEATRLRGELLARGAVGARAGAHARPATTAGSDAREPAVAEQPQIHALGWADGEAQADAGEELATLRWGWLPYHLLSPWTLVLPIVALGGIAQSLDTIGVEGAAQDAAFDGVDQVQTLPLGLAIAVLVVVLLAVGVAAASALFVESWWRYRLTREPGGTLHVRRGLLTTRSITIEQRRLRGVELAEPLTLRAADGAQLHAIVSGLRGSDDGKSARVDALMPSAPRTDTDRVTAAVLQEPALPPQLRHLRPHPPAARRRRLVRGAWAAAIPPVALFVAGPLLGWIASWIWPLGFAAVLPALLLARDAYRSLGHGIAGRYVVSRHGTFVRRTSALQRNGVIGWNMRRSPFQRRVGVVTLTATTAAGAHGYRIIDVRDGDGLAFAEEAVPGVLLPFLERTATQSSANPA